MNYKRYGKSFLDIRASMVVIMRAQMHEEPKHPLKEAKNGGNGVKEIKTKNFTPLFSEGGTDQ
ncbi:hypothetical protein CWI36_0103p0040 [Hamiltosporidium magnivora]|uniref:Uncharacterized protein n=1 Tax=Hamiltosporidium magnivora TaxID=148818 RepID=A0A4Q9LKD5_9MICR|nr:hypothetical protein CWI36_0103p0040 [Hamiltosporidium magnivora]